MQFLNSYLGKALDVDVTGEKVVTGILVDIGLDIIVLYTWGNFFYIPLTHIQRVQEHSQSDDDSYDLSKPSENHPIDQDQILSYRKILNNAKGLFVQIYVSGNQKLHGYITNVLTNYFVFYSPVYKTMFIPLFHLKWLIPYIGEQTPYSLEGKSFPIKPTSITLARTFEEQMKKLEGKIVICDLGLHENKIGHMRKTDGNFIELVGAGGDIWYFNILHLKTVHSPEL